MLQETRFWPVIFLHNCKACQPCLHCCFVRPSPRPCKLCPGAWQHGLGWHDHGTTVAFHGEVAEVVPLGGEVPEPLADEMEGHDGTSDKESIVFKDFKP